MVLYLITLLVLILLSFVYIKIAERYNILDIPNKRSSHTIPVVRGGGILFLIAAWLFFFYSNFEYPYFVLGVTLIAGISFIDDLKTLSASIRMPFQFFAVLLILVEIGFVNELHWTILPVLIFGVGFLNIYNFMDGINGLTGLYSLSILVALYFINDAESIINQDFIGFSILSVLVFGFYNFRKKARFFAGDIGSISMAMVLFFVASYFMMQLEAPVLFLLVVVYGADGIITILYRKFKGQHITEPHREHMYQKLVDVKKVSHIKVSIGYALAQAMANYIVYRCYKLPTEQQYFIWIGVSSVFVIIYVAIFKYVTPSDKKKSVIEGL